MIMEPNVENKMNKNPRKFEPLADDSYVASGVTSNEATDYQANGQYTRDSWKSSFEHLYHDMSRLMVRESELIRTEMGEKFDQIKKSVVPFILGGVMLGVGGLALVATAIIVFNYFMPLWLSAVIVTAVLFVVGGVMIASAKKKLEAQELKPRRSIETLGEIKTTFKERVNEFTQH
jgi:hypothetical protein